MGCRRTVGLSAEHLIDSLCSGALQAAQEAARNGDLRLATLLAQPGHELVQKLIGAQVDQWEKDGRIDDPTMRLYKLIMGDIDAAGAGRWGTHTASFNFASTLELTNAN